MNEFDSKAIEYYKSKHLSEFDLLVLILEEIRMGNIQQLQKLKDVIELQKVTFLKIQESTKFYLDQLQTIVKEAKRK